MEMTDAPLFPGKQGELSLVCCTPQLVLACSKTVLNEHVASNRDLLAARFQG